MGQITWIAAFPASYFRVIRGGRDKITPLGECSNFHLQKIFRVLLGLLLVYADTSHLTFARTEFQAQAPNWVQLGKDLVVVLSGIAEMLLGLSIIFIRKYRTALGWMAALFFVLVFPGNIGQYINHIDSFGLDTDRERLIRLFFSTGAGGLGAVVYQRLKNLAGKPNMFIKFPVPWLSESPGFAAARPVWQINWRYAF